VLHYSWNRDGSELFPPLIADYPEIHRPYVAWPGHCGGTERLGVLALTVADGSEASLDHYRTPRVADRRHHRREEQLQRQLRPPAADP
jgi:hypothetical protein